MSQISFLFQLQKIDSSIDKKKKRLDDINKLREDDSRFFNAKTTVSNFEILIEQHNLEINKTEELINSKKIKFQQSESSLYGGKISNPKELQGLQTEIALLISIISDLEDQLMANLEKEAEINESYLLANKVLADEIRNHKSLLQELELESIGIKNHINNLNKERSMLLPQIDSEHQKMYEELRKSKKGVAVAFVEERSCSACGAGLTPADWQAARSSGKTVICTSCGRILYSE